jgi:hypothetical protein
MLVEKTFGVGIGGVAWVQILDDVESRSTGFVGDSQSLLLQCAQECLEKMQLVHGLQTLLTKIPKTTSTTRTVTRQQRLGQLRRIVDEFCSLELYAVDASSHKALVFRMLTILKSLSEKTTYIGDHGHFEATRFSLLGLKQDDVNVVKRATGLAEERCAERDYHAAFEAMKDIAPVLCGPTLLSDRTWPQEFQARDAQQKQPVLMSMTPNQLVGKGRSVGEKMSRLRRQVEHYFSDKNLGKDAFFSKRIAESKDGWVAVTHVMACPIIQARGSAVEEVLACLAVSKKVEVRLYPFDSIRRIGNSPVGSSLYSCSAPAGRQKRQVKTGGRNNGSQAKGRSRLSLQPRQTRARFDSLRSKGRGECKGKGKAKQISSVPMNRSSKGKGKGKLRCDRFGRLEEALIQPGMTVEKSSAGDLNRLRQLWSMRGGSGQIIDAWKIDNPLKIHMFKMRREQLKKALGREADGLEGFHGTHPDDVISTCEHGLQQRDLSYVATRDPRDCLRDCGGGQYMLVCRLTLGKESTTPLNTDGDYKWIADSGSYLIKDSEQVLPQYIIRFATNGFPMTSSSLEDILSQTKWSTKKAEQIKPVPQQRKCCMSNPHATVLWLGFLHGHLSDESLEADVRRFLTQNARDYVEGMKVQIVKGHFKKAHAILETPIPRELVHKLNWSDFVEDGTTRTICVDDAHGSPEQNCPKFIAGYCRGQNLRFTHPCWCSHPSRTTKKAQYHLTPVSLVSAKGVELIEKFTASGSFHNGTPRVVGINAIGNDVLSRCHEEYRGYLNTKHMEEPAVQELYHGTNNNILDIIYTHGLQPPSDMQASESCPVSGGKGLCTSLCNNDCQYCTEKHEWNQCHMFGLGIYLADSPQKSHHYVSQPRTSTNGRQTYRMVVCSVLGKSFQIDGHLTSMAAMHDVVNVRALTDDMVDEMVDRCQVCFSSAGDVQEAACENFEVAEKSDLLFVRGLGPAARHTITNRTFDDVCSVRCGHTMRPGVSVLSSEYVAFHPHQCLPKYEIEYELE